jgi:hypothetical protein
LKVEVELLKLKVEFEDAEAKIIEELKLSVGGWS